MILEINQDDSQRQRSSSLSNIKEEQSHINSENIFAFDVKYTKMFEKKKEESDDDFFQTFENLKLEKETKKNSVIVEENLSIKEDSSINKDIINLLNSPKQQTINLKKNSSFHSNNSIDENRDSLIKNLAKKSDDFEIKLHSLVDSETKSSVIQNSNKTIFDSIHEDYNINHPFDGKIHLLNNKNYIPRANDQYNNLRHTANSNKNLTPNEVTYNSYHNNINQCNNVPFINNKYPENYYPNTLPSNTILNVTNVYQYNNISLCPKSGLSPIKSIYDNYKMYGDMMNNYVQDDKINYNIVEHSDINNRLLKSTKLIQTPIEDMENYTDEEIEKYAYQLSKEQLGCRFLQKKLDQYIKLGGKIYEKLKDNIIELINDSFGNYLIQKLLEKINIEILEEVLYKIAPHFLSLGLDSHGTRVLQKLLEVIFHNTRLLDLYINIFSPYILLTFIKDINGNHIIQKLVSNLKFPKNSFIYSIVKENLLEIGIHKHGCCALQKCIEAANSVQKEELINLIIQHTQYLIVDQYGNYVVQYIIMMNNHSVNRKIVEMFLKLDFIYIAKQKYSSNVIEKCFDSSDKATKSLIVKQVAQKEIIKNLLFDSYGNYVLQKALSVAEETYYKYIISIIAPKLDKLRLYHSFGNKLYLKLLSKYPELYTTVNNPSKIKNSIPGIKKKNSNFPKKY